MSITTSNLPNPLSSDRKDHGVLDCVINAIKNTPSLAERVGLSQDKVEALYFLGFQLYEMECYQQAADIFRLVCLYEPRVSRNWIALGGAYQHVKSHYNALASFAMASLQEPLNPEPKFYAAHSLVDLNDLPLALECAETAVMLAAESTNQNNLSFRARALRDAIATQIQLN